METLYIAFVFSGSQKLSFQPWHGTHSALLQCLHFKTNCLLHEMCTKDCKGPIMAFLKVELEKE